mmetsp:Transcript_25198/g.62403  ORF Transcript_25198/g.62403 Transcript_25198/m.62403 type:complete len:253 (+) Transcript_25198:428-1186(+)
MGGLAGHAPGTQNWCVTHSLSPSLPHERQTPVGTRQTRRYTYGKNTYVQTSVYSHKQADDRWIDGSMDGWMLRPSALHRIGQSSGPASQPSVSCLCSECTSLSVCLAVYHLLPCPSSGSLSLALPSPQCRFRAPPSSPSPSPSSAALPLPLSLALSLSPPLSSIGWSCPSWPPPPPSCCCCCGCWSMDIGLGASSVCMGKGTVAAADVADEGPLDEDAVDVCERAWAPTRRISMPLHPLSPNLRWCSRYVLR